MIDIVERLRALGATNALGEPSMAHEAAAEIERLRAALAWQPVEALGVSAVVCDGDEEAPISRVYLADCRKCSRRVIAWVRGEDGDFGWGYAPIGECLNPARCGEKQPGFPD